MRIVESNSIKIAKFRVARIKIIRIHSPSALSVFAIGLSVLLFVARLTIEKTLWSSKSLTFDLDDYERYFLGVSSLASLLSKSPFLLRFLETFKA